MRQDAPTVDSATSAQVNLGVAFEVEGPSTLDPAAIDALARLLVDVAEREARREEKQEVAR